MQAGDPPVGGRIADDFRPRLWRPGLRLSSDAEPVVGDGDDRL